MNEQNTYSEITPEILNLAKRCASIDRIDEELYRKYEVKRGLRDISGKGVLAGLTDISEIISYTIEDNDMIPCEGRLFYRGYNIQDLVGGLIQDKRFGYEEIAYLLLSGSLPDEKELADFSHLIGEYRTLPTSFVRDIILKAPSQDMMNTLARSVMDAIDKKYDVLDDFGLVDELSRISGTAVPKAVEELRTAPVLHDTVVEKDEMKSIVKKILNVK